MKYPTAMRFTRLTSQGIGCNRATVHVSLPYKNHTILAGES